VTGAGTMQEFAREWMPDISELDIEGKVKDEVKRLLDTECEDEGEA
jgi:hypothetical protein